MNLSFKQYRAIDLTIMAVMLAVSEAIATTAAAKWFPWQLFSVSTTIAVVCIVMMRWSGYASVHAVIGACVYCLVIGASAPQFAIYCAGNCGMLVALVFFKILGKEKVAKKPFLSVLFVLTAYCGAELGRWAMSLIIPTESQGATMSSPGAALLAFITGDIVSLLFALITVLISRKIDGLFEDQYAYLLRIKEEERKEREAKEREENEQYYNLK